MCVVCEGLCGVCVWGVCVWGGEGVCVCAVHGKTNGYMYRGWSANTHAMEMLGSINLAVS